VQIPSPFDPLCGTEGAELHSVEKVVDITDAELKQAGCSKSW
jgi:hypothetical protein